MRLYARCVRRRQFLSSAAAAGGLALLGSLPTFDRRAAAQSVGASDGYGPLGSPDPNGLGLPTGFTSRIIATTGERVGDTDYRWHANPDGGATFAGPDGGWIYVSNDESDDAGGGVSMVRFDRRGRIVEARSILRGTSRNCAGGPTPWGTWLSCEEYEGGRVWECQPAGASDAQVRSAMGTFSHEAAAVDQRRNRIYLTEDQTDGLLYRFTPDRPGDLSAGVLEALAGDDLDDPDRRWLEVPDPAASETPTRYQLDDALRFDGGEGAWFGNDRLYFTTKGDNRVRTLEPDSGALDVIYDIETSPDPVLSGVDNIVLSAAGELFVCEDGGNMEVVVLHPSGVVEPFLRMDVDGSEVTGAAFDPSGTRFYVSSQRNPGTTFEITGPFRSPARPSPAERDRRATLLTRPTAARSSEPSADPTR